MKHVGQRWWIQANPLGQVFRGWASGKTSFVLFAGETGILRVWFRDSDLCTVQKACLRAAHP